MRVLAIHDGHNASAAILEEGRVVGAVQEERLVREKNFSGYPRRSINLLLATAGWSAHELSAVAYAGMHVPAARNARALTDELRSESRLPGLLKDVASATPFYRLYLSRGRRTRVARVVEHLGTPPALVGFHDHHLCHAAAAWYGAPSRDLQAAVLTLDGSGDGLCASVSTIRDGDLRRLAQTPKGHSVGNVYSRATLLLGFQPWEHEYKLMGMAPYASPEGEERAAGVFRRYLAADGLSFRRLTPEPTWRLEGRMARDLRGVRFDWICAGLQRATTEWVTEWAAEAARRTGARRLCCSGGVFMNVKANYALSAIDGVEDVWILPSCGDETNAIGAGYLESARLGARPVPFEHVYWTQDAPSEEYDRAADAARREGCAVARPASPAEEVARLLAQGHVVARSAGPMEFGARALGNRSILADPIDAGLANRINRMIKKRDFWMPFAPIVLAARAAAHCLNPKGLRSPYMMFAFPTTTTRDTFRAAVHPADDTARFQILEPGQNLEVQAILEAFERLTGRSVLLNTSLNLHGHPIVYRPEEALDVFRKSDLRHLQLGPYLVSKPA